MKNLTNIRIIYILFFIFICSTGIIYAQTFESSGTVKYFSLEGGFFGITGDNGVNYDPMNLGKEFCMDGLKIQFTGKIRDDIMSTRNWGTIIEIISVQKMEKINRTDGLEIYEWGVMVGCQDDDIFFNTSRPEYTTLVKQPVIYVHSGNKNPFDVKVTFNTGKPTSTYPVGDMGEKTVDWKNVNFYSQKKTLREEVDTSRLIPLKELLGTLNNVDADEIEFKGTNAKFLFYEGEMNFTNKVTAQNFPAEKEVKITNNFSYPVFNVVFSTAEGNFMNTKYFSYVIDVIKAGETVTLKTAEKKSGIWINDLTGLGFTEMEAKSFSAIWQQPFLEKTNTSNWANLIYRIPQTELEKMITLEVIPSPSKTVRVMYILVNLDKDKLK
jgi:hypothetical protein